MLVNRKYIAHNLVSILVLSFLCLLSAGIMGCEDDKDLNRVDLSLLDGIWEVVYSGYDDVFARECFLDVSTTPDSSLENTGVLRGTISTFFLTATGRPMADKDYTWEIRQGEDVPLLDITQQGYVTGDDPWAGSYYFTIIRLTDSYLWLQGRTNGNRNIIKLRRRSDLLNSSVPFDVLNN